MAADSKTEKPTPRKRQKAREKGQVARSRELVASLMTGSTLVLLASLSASFPQEWYALFRDVLAYAGRNDLNGLPPAFSWNQLSAFQGVVLAIGMSWLLAGLAAVAQGGFVFASSALAPKVERLSPAAKLGQLFSLTAVSNLIKSLLPGTAIAYVVFAVIARDWNNIHTATHLGIRPLVAFILEHILELSWKAALILLLWSAADYLLQRFKLERDLRMSRQELREEYKETEGNPTVKGRIRRLQRQIRRRRLLDDTKRATVVVTNPTEFAVALEYRFDMAAPRVVAKGRNLLARQIKEVARWHNIPLLENPPLAHALYRAVEVGQVIPPKLYTVVAEVLALVYRLQAESSRGKEAVV
jgi:flagellar biosynthesis protein FlhB